MPTETQAPPVPGPVTRWEQFVNLPPGTVVLITDGSSNGSEWTKAEDGRWQMPGLVPIRAENFQSSVTSGRATITRLPVGTPPPNTVLGDSGLIAALHRYAERVGDDEFDALLAEHSIGRTREHTSRVVITGYSYWTPSMAQAGSLWPHDAAVRITDVEDQVRIAWQATTTVTRSGIGCTCDDVAEEDYQSLVDSLPDNDDWETEVVCDE